MTQSENNETQSINLSALVAKTATVKWKDYETGKERSASFTYTAYTEDEKGFRQLVKDAEENGMHQVVKFWNSKILAHNVMSGLRDKLCKVGKEGGKYSSADEVLDTYHTTRFTGFKESADAYDPPEAQIKTMMAMGFTREQSIAALRAAHAKKGK